MSATEPIMRTTALLESGHWYDPKSRALVETVPSADGTKQVKPDLRHAKKLGLFPGVSTINKQLARPGLEAWKSRQLLLAALTLPRNEGEALESFADRIILDAAQQAADAAAQGTAIHAQIEAWANGAGLQTGPAGLAIESILSEFPEGTDFYGEDVMIQHDYGYAGKTDLQVWKFNQCLALCDIKTVDLASYRKPYPEWARQLAAYSRCLTVTPESHVSIIVDRTTSETRFHEWPTAEIEQAWLTFRDLLAIWKREHNYWPGNNGQEGRA